MINHHPQYNDDYDNDLGVDGDYDDDLDGDDDDDDDDDEGESHPTVGPGCPVGPCLLGPVRSASTSSSSTLPSS